MEPLPLHVTEEILESVLILKTNTLQVLYPLIILKFSMLGKDIRCVKAVFGT